MSKVRVSAFSVSLDGYGAGPKQDIDNPLGLRGLELHDWLFKTKQFHSMTNKDGGATGIDNDLVESAAKNIGAWIIGRNMFGPTRGSWTDESWQGWWGSNPPFQTPVFVLSHHTRRPIEMKGGTTFYFITEGIHSALKQAKAVAREKDVRIGGGVSTIKQYLKAGLVDEMHIALAPVFLGEGEAFFSDLNLPKLGFAFVNRIASEQVTHLFLKREKPLTPEAK